MGTAASSSLRGSSVPGLPLMVLGGLLHRSRSWRGAVLTLHSLVGLLYRPVVASHLPRASGSPRHQSAPSYARACPGAGPHALTIIRIKKPGLNRLYCGGVSECTMSKNLTWPVGKCRDQIPVAAFISRLRLTGTIVALAGARVELKFRSKNSNAFSHGDQKMSTSEAPPEAGRRTPATQLQLSS